MYPIGLLQTPGKPAFPFEVILDCCSARAEDGTTMFVILWEFEVKPECQERFERVYNPHGDWVRLFLRDPRFRSSQLLRDPSRTHFYFTLDFWDSESAYQDFRSAHRASYEELDRHGNFLTEGTLHWFLYHKPVIPVVVLAQDSSQPVRRKIGFQEFSRRTCHAQHGFSCQIATSHGAFHCRRPAGRRPIPGQEHALHGRLLCWTPAVDSRLRRKRGPSLFDYRSLQ